MDRKRSTVLYYADPAQSGPDSASFTSREREILDSVNRRVAAKESVEAVIDFLFDSTRDLSPCDRVSVAFVEEDGRRVVSYYTRALYEPVVLRAGYAEDLHGSSLAEVFDTGRLRVIRDLEQYLVERPGSASTRVLLREGVRSSLTAPLAVEGRRVGFLFRSARTPDAYTEAHVRMHQAVAERLSQAVEKAWRIEQLREANRRYAEMLGFVSHELKSPIASIVMDATLLERGYLGALPPPQQDKLRRMIRKGQSLLALIEEYLELARMEGGALPLRSRTDVDFSADVVHPVLEMLRSQIEERKMVLEREGPETAVIDADPALLQIVLSNLLNNAIKYGNEGGRVRLTVQSTDSRFRVSVWNEGAGFPDSERPRLFRRFSRLTTPELRDRKGSGVGLYTAWRIIQLHHGRIWARSEYGEWAEFTFEIPQPLPVAAAE